MEKKARSPRRAPAAYGDERVATRGQRARTLADATDPRAPTRYRARSDQGGYGEQGDYFEQEYSARDEQAPSGPPHFTLPSHPSIRAVAHDSDHIATRRRGKRGQRGQQQQASWDEYARHGDDWSAASDDEDAGYTTTGRSRAQSVARPLSLIQAQAAVAPAAQSNPRALVRADSVPDLIAWRPPFPAQRKPVYTRAIETAHRHPWSVSRSLLALITVAVTLILSLATAGEPSQPLMQFFNVQAAGASAQSIADQVQPLTQARRVDQYDSVAQYNTYWDAACSAAVLSEVLTAWGIKGVTIGRAIDELGSYISPYGGLLSYAGFQRVAGMHDMRSDFRENLSYKQMLYITNTLHLPLIVNVRMSYGFYHFFSGGHFMVMTAGDSQGLRLVDSSLYYVHYMPLSVFNSMFTGRTVLLTPSDYIVNLPPA